ncbi:MAG: hypothetical protein AB1779_00250 [Candidatus Thermoplasmatota archaeon]
MRNKFLFGKYLTILIILLASLCAQISADPPPPPPIGDYDGGAPTGNNTTEISFLSENITGVLSDYAWVDANYTFKSKKAREQIKQFIYHFILSLGM